MTDVTILGSPTDDGQADQRSLADVLSLAAVGAGVFRADPLPGGPPAVFGGQLLGQSVVAAGRTVHDGMTPTSMHAYFERPGDPATPIDYAVDEIRDSRSSARRLVRGTQYGRLVSTAELSFSRDSAGRADPVRPAVDPEAATWSIDDAPVQHREGLSTWLHGLCTMLRLDVRFLHEPVRLQVMRRGRAPAGERFLVRPADPIPEDPLVQAAAVAYLSDMFLLAGSLGPRGVLMGGRNPPRGECGPLDLVRRRRPRRRLAASRDGAGQIVAGARIVSRGDLRARRSSGGGHDAGRSGASARWQPTVVSDSSFPSSEWNPTRS
ncbi:acyl-CoA thioesterase [Gordonia humi]